MDFDPALFSNLLDLDLKVERDNSFLTKVRKHALRKSVLKKHVNPANRAALSQAAIENFLKLNGGLVGLRLIDATFDERTILDYTKNIIYDSLTDRAQCNIVTLNNAVHYGRTGPGASVGASSNDFVTKLFESSLTATHPILYEHYVRAISGTWSEAELLRNADLGIAIVAGSKLSTVPKDQNRDRTICTEPILNMFYQLGIKHILESSLSRHHSIDVRTQQDKNRALARFGSIDGALSTVDLKDASDSISLSLCEYLLPKEALDTLMLTRSPVTTAYGVAHELRMISTMGNGFTFPLMTLILSSLVRAIYMYVGLKPVNGINYGVFGDDIIIDSKHYTLLTRMLDICGFTVNLTKSFSKGFFRESCGGDYYRGANVRGVYLKESNHETNIYSFFNRLHAWSISNDVPLWRSLHYLKGLVDFRPVPGDAGYHQGFIIPSIYLTNPKRSETGAIYYRPLEPIVRRRRVGDVSRNPLGALTGFLGGYVRNSFVTVREDLTNYKIAKRRTQTWDGQFHVEGNLLEFEQSWYMLLNM